MIAAATADNGVKRLLLYAPEDLRHREAKQWCAKWWQNICSCKQRNMDDDCQRQ
jgi:hypothetical protein